MGLPTSYPSAHLNTRNLTSGFTPASRSISFRWTPFHAGAPRQIAPNLVTYAFKRVTNCSTGGIRSNLPIIQNERLIYQTFHIQSPRLRIHFGYQGIFIYSVKHVGGRISSGIQERSQFCIFKALWFDILQRLLKLR